MVKLLIVDDEHIIRTGLQSLDWTSVNVEVCAVADSGITALEEVLRHMPDIVLTDVMMPGMTGLELASKARKINENCIFVFFSGYAEFYLVKEALAIQAFDYILKPSDPQEIFDCVTRAIEKLNSLNKSQVNFSKSKINTRYMFDIDEFIAVKNEQAAKITDYIKLNYTGECSLHEASSALHYSPVHINRILKKNKGYTFHELLMTVRLFKSREYIANTQLSILDVAEKVGISDQRYFSQVFKRTFSLSPRNFRKMHGICDDI